MKRFTLMVFAVLIAFCFVLASQGRAWGYVDPGSGLLALQGFATATAGVLYYMRRRIMAFFSRQDVHDVQAAKPPALKVAERDRPGKVA